MSLLLRESAKNIFWFDTETTGLTSEHEIIQIAGFVEIKGVVKCRFNIKSQPTRFDNISEEALKVNGKTIEEIRTYPKQEVMYKKLLKIFNHFKPAYNDRFYLGGWNVRFDLDKLTSLFNKRDEFLKLWNFSHLKMIDGLPYCHLLDYLGVLKLKNYKLETVANHYGVKVNAHDAMADIIATKELTSCIFKDLDEKFSLPF
jgi:DNA polymerase-3 subunit epsilon